MNKSYSRRWVHLLFSTKYAQPLIGPSSRDEIYAHLHSQLMEMDCLPRVITGTEDHVHLLFLENHKLALSEIVKQLKGNTSHWINDHDLTRSKFVWQKGYAAFSENAMSLPQVIEILNNQEEYHKSRSFIQELDELISAHLVESGVGSDIGIGDSRREK